MPTPNENLRNLYSLDVEADGPCPGLYSMLSFGLVPLGEPERGFYTTLAPISDKYLDDALRACNFTRAQTLSFKPADQAMADLAQWLAERPQKGRPVIWSDNPAFDWQFFNYYCHAFLGSNPFGHSARRIGDYHAGTQRNPRDTQGWKKWRTEPHTHNALEDARGNAGALRRVLALKPDTGLMAEAEIGAYRLPGDITLEAVPQLGGPARWAVRRGHQCLNRAGEWEWEPQPSSRDEAFYARCRWPTAESAYGAWEQAERLPKSQPGR